MKYHHIKDVQTCKWLIVYCLFYIISCNIRNRIVDKYRNPEIVSERREKRTRKTRGILEKQSSELSPQTY